MSTKKRSHELFINSHHSVSKRFAIFEDDGTSAWLYLTEPDDLKIASDAWIHNRVDAPPASQVTVYRPAPPPAAIGYASNTALCEAPHAHDWKIIWSQDGHSVALSKDGVPVGCITLTPKASYSKELVKDGPWGKPWSGQVFDSYF